MKNVWLLMVVALTLGWVFVEMQSTWDGGEDVSFVERARSVPDVHAESAPRMTDAPERVTLEDARPLPPSKRVVVADGRTRVTFAVRDGARFAPVPKARVVVFRDEEELARGTSDADGRVTLEVTAGEVYVFAVADEARLFGQMSRTVGESANVVEIEVLVERLASVSGVVRDGATEQPLPDVLVSNDVSDSRAFEHVEVRTDAQGKFEFPYVEMEPSVRSDFQMLEFELVEYEEKAVSLEVDRDRDRRWRVRLTELNVRNVGTRLEAVRGASRSRSLHGPTHRRSVRRRARVAARRCDRSRYGLAFGGVRDARA